jgi:hypothetical protein
MNPITAFMVLACLLIAAATFFLGYFFLPYLFLVAAVLIDGRPIESRDRPKDRRVGNCRGLRRNSGRRKSVALQDAMSRQAQAKREKQARVILGSAQVAIAGKCVEAAAT